MQLLITLNEDTFGVILNGKTILSGLHSQELAPKKLKFNKNGSRLHPMGDGKYLNPAYFNDKRKPAAVDESEVAKVRFETPEEVVTRVTSAVAELIKNTQR